VRDEPASFARVTIYHNSVFQLEVTSDVNGVYDYLMTGVHDGEPVGVNLSNTANSAVAVDVFAPRAFAWTVAGGDSTGTGDMVGVLPTGDNLSSWSFGSGGSTANDFTTGLGVGAPVAGSWLPLSVPSGHAARVKWDEGGYLCSALFLDGCHTVVPGVTDPGLIDASGVFVVGGTPKIGWTYFVDDADITATAVVEGTGTAVAGLTATALAGLPAGTATAVAEVTETAEAALTGTAVALTPTVPSEPTVVVLPTYTATGGPTATDVATLVATVTFTPTVDGNATVFANMTATGVAALTQTAVVEDTATAVVVATGTAAAVVTETAVVVATQTAAARLTVTSIAAATQTAVAVLIGTPEARATQTAAARLTGTAVALGTATAQAYATQTAVVAITQTAVMAVTQTAVVVATSTAAALVPGPCGAFDSLISGLHSVDCDVQALPTRIAGEFIPTTDLSGQLTSWQTSMNSRFPLAVSGVIRDCVSPLFGSGSDDLVITLPGLGLGNFDMRVAPGAFGGLTVIVSRILASIAGAFYLWSIGRRFLGLGGGSG
jgi:hypothetical protein